MKGYKIRTSPLHGGLVPMISIGIISKVKKIVLGL